MSLSTNDGGRTWISGTANRFPPLAVAKRFSEFERPVEWRNRIGIDHEFDGAGLAWAASNESALFQLNERFSVKYQILFRRDLKAFFTEAWISSGKPDGSCVSIVCIAVSTALTTSANTSLARDRGKPARSAVWIKWRPLTSSIL